MIVRCNGEVIRYPGAKSAVAVDTRFFRLTREENGNGDWIAFIPMNCIIENENEASIVVKESLREKF